ncbi:hypothetical protein [Dyadobacter tibetensis]|uniref:hypothetical protein n=1 Tax=Dyadobacter tibetensis TaxID=1211851 RepID=UPI0004718C86|nr:hypothetical protein [Dyadobacter tibetensis]
MKKSITSIAFIFALCLSFAVSAEDSDKGNKKAASFGAGIYTTQEGKINVLIDKFHSESPTQLLVKNHIGDIVYRETISKKSTKFGRTLNINNLEAGAYSIEVISNGERQIRKFEIGQTISQREVSLEL